MIDKDMENKDISYRVDDKEIDASAFVMFVNKIWPGDYDMNITAYDNDVLVGCVRILSDGYYFGTITELLVLPEYQKHGIGSKLIKLARDNTPTMLYFGAQAGVEEFYEKNGCKKSLQSYEIAKERQ